MTDPGQQNEPTAPPLLVVDQLSRHFRGQRRYPLQPRRVTRAIDGISFALHAKETLGLVGESGCGKSTTGRIVLGMDQPTTGSVIYDGNNWSTITSRQWRLMRQNVQLIFQDPLSSLDPRMQVSDQIREPLDIHDIGDSANRSTRVLDVLDAVGLPAAIATRYPHELSGGQQQRVVIARALILEPKLLVCDEPVAALDVSVQAQVINLLAQLQERFDIAYLFISHDLKIVRHISHRVAIMYLGQIVETGATDTIFNRPRHPYTEALISAIPVPDPSQRRERIILKGDLPSPANPPPGCRFHTRCPKATAVCTEAPPPLKQLQDGREVACHLVQE